MSVSSFKKTCSLFMFLLFFPCMNHSYGLGCLAHNYVAEQTIPLLSHEPELFQIISDHLNDYLIGSDYPDTGFMPWATYGEISHWQPFADAYIQHLHEQYPLPSIKRNRLLAFLMGIGTHNQSDYTAHWTYYDLVAKYDFDNKPDVSTAWQTAHQYMDPASDFYVIVNKQIFNHPFIWWIPVNDLVSIYQIMNHQVSAEEIIRSNAIYYVALGLDENFVALPAYLFDRWYAIPWGITHLESPDTETLRYGAFPGQIADSANYLSCLWHLYQNHQTKCNVGNAILCQPLAGRSSRPSLSPFIQFAQKAIENKWIEVNPLIEDDGSVTFTPERITITEKFKQEKIRFFTELNQRHIEHSLSDK